MKEKQESVNCGRRAGLRVIDCHGHLGRFSQTNIAHPDAESMLRVMDRVGVEKICLSAFLSIGPDYETGNDMVAEAVKMHPDRFIGYAVINPNRAEMIERELDRCFDRLGMRAIKLHPAFHRYPVDGSAYWRVYDYAARRRVPILSHEWGRPQFLDSLANQYPEVSFIIAHTGFWDGRSDFPYAEVVNHHENVLIDLAYSNIYQDALERLVDLIGAEKIVFGSDFPLHDLAYQLGRVLFAKLSDEQKGLIAGENMLRVLEG
jgi:predicted TIM-barrel fold metal-dependent hydrolase